MFVAGTLRRCAGGMPAENLEILLVWLAVHGKPALTEIAEFVLVSLQAVFAAETEVGHDTGHFSLAADASPLPLDGQFACPHQPLAISASRSLRQLRPAVALATWHLIQSFLPAHTQQPITPQDEPQPRQPRLFRLMGLIIVDFPSTEHL